MNYDICIIGGGFAGAATAHYLAKERAERVVLIEQEPAPGMHASGHNASLLRQSVPDRAIGGIALRSIQLLEGLRSLNGSVQRTSCGSYLLASGQGRQQLDDIERVAKETGLKIIRESKAQVLRRMPVLEAADFSDAVFCPEDGVIDAQVLLHTFIETAKEKGVTLQTTSKLTSVKRKNSCYEIQLDEKAGRQAVTCKRLVNAAGAWSNTVAQLLGLKPKPLRICGRHLFFAARPEVIKPGWPYVWDLSHGLYFRPYDTAQILLSPCDEEVRTPERGTQKIKEGIGKVMRSKLKRYMPFLSDVKFERITCELRTLSADGRFIIGPDPDDPNFFWVSGLGGHGVTTSTGIGELAAHLLLNKSVECDLVDWFSPSRF